MHSVIWTPLQTFLNLLWFLIWMQETHGLLSTKTWSFTAAGLWVGGWEWLALLHQEWILVACFHVRTIVCSWLHISISSIIKPSMQPCWEIQTYGGTHSRAGSRHFCQRMCSGLDALVGWASKALSVCQSYDLGLGMFTILVGGLLYQYLGWWLHCESGSCACSIVTTLDSLFGIPLRLSHIFLHMLQQCRASKTIIKSWNSLLLLS